MTPVKSASRRAERRRRAGRHRRGDHIQSGTRGCARGRQPRRGQTTGRRWVKRRGCNDLSLRGRARAQAPRDYRLKATSERAGNGAHCYRDTVAGRGALTGIAGACWDACNNAGLTSCDRGCKMPNEYRPLVCGTRKTKRLGPTDYRVICATCDGGGTVKHATHDSAARAAIRDSNKPCPVNCGAK